MADGLALVDMVTGVADDHTRAWQRDVWSLRLLVGRRDQTDTAADFEKFKKSGINVFHPAVGLGGQAVGQVALLGGVQRRQASAQMRQWW